MSQEVFVNDLDYRTSLSWFERLFADGGRKPSIDDKRVYQKLTVMWIAHTDDMNFLQDDKRKDKDQDDRRLGR